MPNRIELTDDASPRKTIDATWSKKKKLVVGSATGLVAIAAITTGVVLAARVIPPSLPTDAHQAVAVINSGRLDNLDEDRRQQYLTESARLFRDLPEEQRFELVRDEDTRDAMRQMFQAQMEEMVRAFARGDEIEMPWRRGGPGARQGGNRNGEGNQDRERQRPPADGEGDGEGDDGRPSRAERQAMMRDRITESFSSGNAQTTALFGEMGKRRRAMREERGGG